MKDRHASEAPLSPDQLKQLVRGGTRAVFAVQLLSQLVSLAVLAALYKLVAPDAFGLIGMAMPLLLLVRLLAPMGLNVASVQRSRISREQVAALFWAQLLLALAGAGLLAAAGPAIAWLYGAPELVWICAALAGTVVLAGAGAQHQALLERRMRIGRLAGARLAAQLVGGLCGIWAAIAGWGVWALVVQQYAELATLDLAVWLADPWLPGRWQPGIRIREMFGFGGYYTLSSLMFFAALHADKVLLALLLGSTTSGQAVIGMYTQAFNLMMKPVYLVTTPLTGVMLPALSRARGHQATYAGLVAAFYRLVGLTLLPAGVGLAVVAPDLLAVLGGPRWQPAGWMLALLAPAVAVQGFVNIAGSVLASAGRADRLFYGSLVMALVYGQGYLAGYWFGQRLGLQPLGAELSAALGVAASYSLVTILVLLVPYLLYTLATAGVSAASVFHPLRPLVLAASLMGLVVWTTRGLLVAADVAPGLRLLVVVAVGAACYALLARGHLGWLAAQLRSR